MKHAVLDLENTEFYVMKEVTSLARNEERNCQPEKKKRTLFQNIGNYYNENY